VAYGAQNVHAHFEAFFVPMVVRFPAADPPVVLKSRLYREVKTMSENLYKATVHYAGDQFFIGIPPSGHAQVMDSKGDRHAATTPLEMLLVSVAACTAMDVQSILEKKRQDVTGYDVEVEGTRVDEHPRKFVKFHIHHIVHGRNVSEKAVADAIELSDTKYCSVAATVRPTAEITTSYEIIESEV
jgi:putative redox protein